MRNLKTVSLALLTLLFSAIAITSCDWDNSPEPEHPLYVTYTISAGYVSFIGPDVLLDDIQTWIKENQSVYDKPVNYTTGEASEFEKTDNEAIKKYEEFATSQRHAHKVRTVTSSTRSSSSHIPNLSAVPEHNG